jgi:hypothetical protein
MCPPIRLQGIVDADRPVRLRALAIADAGV